MRGIGVEADDAHLCPLLPNALVQALCSTIIVLLNLMGNDALNVSHVHTAPEVHTVRLQRKQYVIGTEWPWFPGTHES